MKFETRVKTIIVAPVGEPMLSEKATEISIEDQGAGEYIVISQCHGGASQSIMLDPGAELDQVLAAARRLARGCQ
jgi:hypothetical protein